MKGDKIILESFHLEIAGHIIDRIANNIATHERYCISVAGESGSGKSVTGYALKEALNNQGIKTEVIQQDDYFFLPPKTNEMNRRVSLENVGPQEVNLTLIDAHIQQFIEGSDSITKPLVIFFENCATTETLDLTGVKVLIIEGTYTSLLKNVNSRIFINRDWDSRLQSIKSRARDVVDDFLEQVLTIEHRIISQHQQYADIVIGEGVDVQFAGKQ